MGSATEYSKLTFSAHRYSALQYVLYLSNLCRPFRGICYYLILTLDTLLSSAICWMGSHLLARSGKQLYVADEYSEEDRRPILEVMADPCE